MENNDFTEIDNNYLKNYWFENFGDDSDAQALLARRQFINCVKSILAEDDAEKIMHLDTLGFKIPIKTALIGSTLSVPFLVVLLRHMGVLTASLTIVAQILPQLLNTTQVKLTHEQDEIRLSLPLKKFDGEALAAELWYDKLPKNIKKNISQGKFYDLLDELVYGGLALKDDQGYRIFQKGKKILKFSII